MRKMIISEHKAASCYFRSSVVRPYRKALLQITERCNLRCAHCFLSSRRIGQDMPADVIRKLVIPKLKSLNVISITLTGGEPFAHPNIIEIVGMLRFSGIKVGVCTNGAMIDDFQIEALAEIGEVHANVSLDGFRPESHGRFRGNKQSFGKTIKSIHRLGNHGLLQGLLVTPNKFAVVSEYAQLCKFAIQNNASYVLMNPLSSMGRGVKNQKKLRASDNEMRSIKNLTDTFSDSIQVVYVRFPNDKRLPLLGCEAGNIFYIFANGNVAICPYLVFAARSKQGLYAPEKFIIGNIFDDDIAEVINSYKFSDEYFLGQNQVCGECHLDSVCGKGCPAAVVAMGKRIAGGIDYELCPF